MEDVIATYWMWLVAPLLLGGAIGYRLPRRTLYEGGSSRHLAIWGGAACLLALAEAVLQWFPLSAVPDLEAYLLIALAFALGGFLGGWARAIAARAELARAIVAGDARVEGAVLGARAKAAVRSDQDEAVASAQASKSEASKSETVESEALVSARLAVEARAAELARVAVAKVVGDERVAEAEKVGEDDRAAAATTEAAVAVSTGQAEAYHPGNKPQGIATPAQGEADDLKMIRGIGPRNEKACNSLGIYTFRQIAEWTPAQAIWVGHYLAFPGRIEREHWTAQAKLLASGVETEHAKAVRSGGVAIGDGADEPLDPAAAEMLGKSLPEQAAAIDGEHKHPGLRPAGVVTASGKADDLKRIHGIGPRNAGRLHQLGIWHFSQIAAWNDDNVKWVGSFLAFSGRIHREDWVAQARDLASGREPGRPINKAAASSPPVAVALAASTRTAGEAS
jgi:predicted flap endonuclease-1-like 5' DNA nuclease